MFEEELKFLKRKEHIVEKNVMIGNYHRSGHSHQKLN